MNYTGFRKYINFCLLLSCFFVLSLYPKHAHAEDTTFYFQWFGQSDSEQLYLTGIQAYPQESEDIVELYGIDKSNIDAFVEGNLLVLTLQDVQFSLDTQYYSEESNPYLTYCLVNGLPSRTVIHFMLEEGDIYQITQASDCVRIIFSSTYESRVPEISSPDYSDSVSSEEYSEMYADNIRIPLPEDGIASISTQDNYLDTNFKFILSGNLVSFLKENAILNPYDCIQNHTIYYDASSDKTIITFNTKYVCGYTYEITERYLVVKVGRPSEIYSKIVLFDAGHGGIDPGAVKSGYKEKDINFSIANTYIKDIFYNTDIKVYFTRESDSFVDLYVRAAYAEQVEADLFISLHANANNSSSITGTEVFYSNANNTVNHAGLNSSVLAEALVNNIAPVMETKNRGASSADFIVVKYNTVPAVLIELGFMTNTNELTKLTSESYQRKVANAVYQTVLQIFEEYPTGR